jgi:hypothetical protein
VDGELLGGRYRVIGRVGRGGFATVHEAEHVELGHKVAIKVLDVSRCAAESVARFQREAEALTRLAHPSAVKVFDRGETDDGRLWIAMEYLDGQTLDRRIAEGVLFAGELVELLRPLCELLAEAHEKGIVHRDLKPANIMLLPLAGGGWSPKLFDFGIATLRDDAAVTHPELVSGTPAYMAPEQWQGLAFADARSDIYSLGVIAYQCLSGALPVEADSSLAWINKHRHEPVRDLDDALGGRPVPGAVRDAVMQALAKHPDERPVSAMAFWRALTAELAPARPSRRRVLRWAAPAIAVPLLGSGAAVWWAQQHGASAPACPALPGSYMPLTVGSWWRYRVTNPTTFREQAMPKTIRLDRTGDIGGRKAGVIGVRLAREDVEGTAYRWLARAGEAIVWHQDEWYDTAGTLKRRVFFEPWRLRVDDACAHRTAGVRWRLGYDRIDTIPTQKTTRVDEEWTIEAIADEVTVPAGTFRALKLHRHRFETETQRDSWYWFVPGVGKVKEDSAPEEQEELETFHVAPA